MDKREFYNDQYYHVYNRGTDKREIFSNAKDYDRFLETIRFVNNKETLTGLSDHKRRISQIRPFGSVATDPKGLLGLVEIICYCLNPNHYHFILKQLADGGIPLFMGKLSNSYTKYFNIKYKRSGSLFQGPFKSVHIDSNEYLLHLSAYINGNNFIHGYHKDMTDWPYSSFLDYIGKRNDDLCRKEIILGQFGNNQKEYEKFVKNNAVYLREKKEFQKYLLEG